MVARLSFVVASSLFVCSGAFAPIMMLTSGKSVSVGTLKSVMRRGMGAFSQSHSPVVRSREQWGMARVNAFLRLKKSGKPDNPKYTQDNDLL